MKIKVDYLVGKTTLSEWSGVYGYKPDDSDEIEFFSVMRLKADSEEISLEMIAKMLFDEVQTAFFDDSNPEKDLTVRLETAAWKMKSKMDLILSREEEMSQKGLDIESAIAVVYQNYLYVGVIGESKVFIKRGEELVELSKVLIDGDMSGFLKSGSLEIEDSDRIFITTSNVEDHFTSEMTDAIETLNINSLTNALNENGVAGILIADEKNSWHSAASPLPNDSEITEDEYFEQEPIDRVENQIVETEEEEEIEEPNQFDPAEDDEEVEYEESLTLKERVTPVLLNAKVKLLGIADKAKSLKNRGKVEEMEDDGATRFTNMSDEEDEYEVVEESSSLEKANEIKNKVFTGASKVSSVAQEKWKTNIGPRFQNNQKTYMQVIKNILSKLKNLIVNVFTFLKSELIGTGDRRDYMRGKDRSRNRKIAVVVVVLLIVVLFFGLRSAEANRKEQEKVETARKSVDSLKDKYESLSNQVSQNQSENDDKKTLLLNEFNKLSSDVDNQKKAGLFMDELNSITSGIQSSSDELLFIEAFTQPKLITDVGKTTPDANLTDIVYSNGAVFISDSAKNVVYRVSSATLDNRPEAYVSGLVQPYLLVKDAAGDIVFYDNDNTSALGKFGFSDPKLTRFGQLSLASIGKPAESVIFDGNNSLYELKANNKQIFKRDKSGDTYINGGAATSTDSNTNWRTDLDYGNGIDIAAPYEIYVLINGQGIKRYFARAENTLTFDTYNNFLKKDFDSLGKATAMDVTSRYMAVGDPVNKRVMIFQVEDNEDKNITFIKQFVYRGSENIFSDIKEVAINDQERAVYVLDSSKVIKLQF